MEHLDAVSRLHQSVDRAHNLLGCEAPQLQSSTSRQCSCTPPFFPSSTGMLLSLHHGYLFPSTVARGPPHIIRSSSNMMNRQQIHPACPCEPQTSTVSQQLLSQLSHAVPHPRESLPVNTAMLWHGFLQPLAWFPSNPSLKPSFATIPALLSPTKPHCASPFTDTVRPGHGDNLLAFTSCPTAGAEVALLHLSCTSLGSGLQQ